MIKSMTGFGRAEGTIGTKKFTVEVRALNGKQLDLGVRMPSVYKQKEMDLRSYLADDLVRGKCDVTIFYEADASEKKITVNKGLMEAYYTDLKEVADDIGQTNTDFMSLLMRIPDVLRPEKEEIDENEWNQVINLIKEALQMLNTYRSTEGNKLQDEFQARIDTIMSLYGELEEPLNQRTALIRERIQNNLEELVDTDKIDSNRFEQELIYYLERLDVSEERQRLKSNCDYFVDVMRKGSAQGKKLGFISQEIGREINTLGSKANNSDVQRVVVQMKDELEKIKEQVLNVL